MLWLFVVGLLALVASLAWHQEIAKEISKELTARFMEEKSQTDGIDSKQQLTDASLELTKANLKLKEKDATIDTIQKDLVKSKQQLMDANLKLAEANMTSQRLTTLFQYSKDAAADSVKLEKLMAEKSIDKKQKSLKASEERIKALEEDKTFMNATIDNIVAVNDDLSMENSKLLGSIVSEIQKLDASRDIRDTLARSNAELAAKVDSLTSDNASLRNRIVSLEGDGWDLHHRVEFKITELRDMTVQLEQHALKNADMREYITELQEMIDEKEVESQAYKQNMTATIHALEGQIRDLTARSETQRDQMSKDKEHIQELTIKFKVQKDQMHKDKEHMQELTTKSEAQKTEMHRNQECIQELANKCHAHWGRICDLRATHAGLYNRFFTVARERDQAKETCAKITAKVNHDISVALGKLEKALGDINIVRNDNKALKEENEQLACEVRQLVEHLESRVPEERTGYGYVFKGAGEGDCAVEDENLCVEFAEEIRGLGYMCNEGYQSEWDESEDEDEYEGYDADHEGTDPWEAYNEPTIVIGNWDKEDDGGVDMEVEDSDPWEAHEESATVVGDWDTEKEGWYGVEDKADPWMKYNEPTTIIGTWSDEKDGHKDENSNVVVSKTAIEDDLWVEYNGPSDRIGSWEDDDTVFLSDTDDSDFQMLESIEGIEIDAEEYEALRMRQRAAGVL